VPSIATSAELVELKTDPLVSLNVPPPSSVLELRSVGSVDPIAVTGSVKVVVPVLLVPLEAPGNPPPPPPPPLKLSPLLCAKRWPREPALIDELRDFPQRL
jgi:hypothetical protein